MLSVADGRRITRAWESFATGENTVDGVRPEILASWYRCRDQYAVDPGLTIAPGATDRHDQSFEHDVVLAKLGGIAAMAGQEVELDGSVVTVTDETGRVLASWGDHSARRRADESNLAPWSAWSERMTGTNGMGTALEVAGPVSVTGPEHWCAGFQRWACAGVAVRDVVTGSPIASINISRWGAPLPEQVVPWLGRTAATLEADVRHRATHDGQHVVDSFHESGSREQGPFAGMDIGGRVVIANSAAAELLGVPRDKPMIDPAERRLPDCSKMPALFRWAVGRARNNPQWIGTADLAASSSETDVPVSFRPVFATNHLVGMICDFSSQDGEPYEQSASSSSTPAPHRVIGTRNDRLIVLAPAEIRYAEADRNKVWLVTDRGRIQASTRGLDNVDSELSPHGFFRIHRRFLVNLRRVAELERGVKGELLLITDPRSPEFLPVSRRHAHEVRRVLGV